MIVFTADRTEQLSLGQAINGIAILRADYIREILAIILFRKPLEVPSPV
jgi:hypothetical protein